MVFKNITEFVKHFCWETQVAFRSHGPAREDDEVAFKDKKLKHYGLPEISRKIQRNLTAQVDYKTNKLSSCRKLVVIDEIDNLS